MMTQKNAFRLLLGSIATMLVGFAGFGIAHAQEAAPLVPAANNPNGALAAWAVLGYAAIGALVSVLRPDNTTLPFTVPVSVRAYVAMFGGIIMACLLAIVNGTPWLQAVGVAFSSALVAFAQHGARTTPGATPVDAAKQKSGRPPPIVGAALLTMAALVLGGCAALGTPKGQADTDQALACIETHATDDAVAGEPPLQVAEDVAGACGLSVWTVLQDLTRSKKAFAPASKGAVLLRARAQLTAPAPAS